MSFVEQERAMFDLIYDRTLRQQFMQDSVDVLTEYELSAEELDDFRKIRPDALEIDANMRVYMVLVHLCRELPLTFSIASSFSNGVEKLKLLVDKSIMQSQASERANIFANRVRDWLLTEQYETEVMRSKVVSIIGAEIAMTSTEALLKQAVVSGETITHGCNTAIEGWASLPAKLTSYVCAVIIPRSYVELKQKLCPDHDEKLWAYLGKETIASTLVTETLRQDNPRLLLARAIVSDLHYCEPTISRQMIELSDGFAMLLQYLDGQHSVEYILENLKQTGASEKILQGIRSGFNELYNQGILEVVNTSP